MRKVSALITKMGSWEHLASPLEKRDASQGIPRSIHYSSWLFFFFSLALLFSLLLSRSFNSFFLFFRIILSVSVLAASETCIDEHCYFLILLFRFIVQMPLLSHFRSWCVFVFLLLSTPTGAWCLCPCCRHHSSLSSGARGPYHLRFFFLSYLHHCETSTLSSLSHHCRPCGDLVSSGPALAVLEATSHPSWWFPLWLRCFLHEITRVFQPPNA